MRHSIVFAAGSVAVLGLAFAADRFSVASGEEKKGKDKKAEEFTPPAPGPEHEALKMFEGKWEGKSWMRMSAEAPPMEGKVSEESRMGCGGLWLVSDTKGESAMGPFEGHGVIGYDTEKKKYVGTWVDSMAAYLFLYEGTYDKDAKTWTYAGKAKDMQGKPLQVTMKTVVKDKDHYTFSMHHPDESGKPMEAFRIEYSRKK